MSQTRRFGSGAPMPSTRQIEHDLRIFCAQAEARFYTSVAEMPAEEQKAGALVATVAGEAVDV